MELTADLGKGR